MTVNETIESPRSVRRNVKAFANAFLRQPILYIIATMMAAKEPWEGPHPLSHTAHNFVYWCEMALLVMIGYNVRVIVELKKR